MKNIDKKKNWRTKLIVTNKGWLMHIWKLMTWHGGDTAEFQVSNGYCY